jgi:hypothetical protein
MTEGAIAVIQRGEARQDAVSLQAICERRRQGEIGVLENVTAKQYALAIDQRYQKDGFSSLEGLSCHIAIIASRMGRSTDSNIEYENK